MNFFLWAIFPYIALTLLCAGLIWRWRNDQFGWTTRSSQLNENTILRASSPLFHIGILCVALGHVMGLVFPQSWTASLGVSGHIYHLVATGGGTLAAVAVLIGLAGLLYRRFVIHSVRLATSRNDIVMYVLLTIPILLGAYATVVNQIFGSDGGYNYRETISVWFRSLFIFQPRIDLMIDVPLSFKLHIIAGLILFALWPFTRLVHAFSAPVGYTTRPYIIYRTREASTSAAPPRRGWQPVGSHQDTHHQAPSHGA